ncbi:MAG: TRAP transporter small permease [Burkholderiaceae bacterium]|nr:TRAP transporter small permease [Burkholderiaceae bacterium]
MPLHAAEALIDRAARMLAHIGAVCTLAMLALICADVFARTLLRSPLPGINEVVSYWLMVGLVFLPLGVVSGNRLHIEVEMVSDMLPSRGRAILFHTGRALSAALLALLVWAAVEPAVSATRIRESTDATVFELPLWPVRWAVLAACAVAMLVELRLMLRPAPAEAAP